MSHRDLRTAIAVVGWLAAVSSAPVAAQTDARRAAEPQTFLRTKSPLPPNDLELLEPSVAAPTPRRHSVTDLAVRLKANPNIPISVALALGNGDQRLRGRSIFQIELLLVASGKLLVEERAECRAWQGDVSICETECDGGQFALARTGGAGRQGLRLIIGAIPDSGRDNLSSGVKIAACSDGERAELSLSPRQGLRQVVIDLARP